METGRARLRDWLRKTHTVQRELAHRLDISDAYLSQILSGLRRPKLELLHLIEDVAGVPVSSWLETPRSTSDRQAKPSAKLAVFTGRKSR